MNRHRWRSVLSRLIMALTLGLTLALAMSIGLGGGASRVVAAARASCDGPQTGQHIYDCANLLTPAEIATLETDATAVEQAGAPTVVYLQVKDATVDETLQDASDLMKNWDVESSPGALDGFVIFFNLQPGNLRHGQVALFAGNKHFQHGNLPQRELDRIREQVMTPLLQNGQTADGIAAGLRAVANDLRHGPPPLPGYVVVAQFLGRVPISLLALLLGGLAVLLYRRRRHEPLPSATTSGTGAALAPQRPPGTLTPAMAGALTSGSIGDAQVEATVLDFAQRGMLVIEPAGKKKVQMRLLGHGSNLSEYEQAVWNGLVAQASQVSQPVGGQQILTSADLTRARLQWKIPKTVLRRDLTAYGWYNPELASQRRRPLYIAAIIGIVGAVVALALRVVSTEAWALIAMTIFLADILVALSFAIALPNTTVAGEQAAASWREYLLGIKKHGYRPNLETDLPYIVALGLAHKLAPQLKAASQQGFAPAWFHASVDGQRTSPVGFYPYWIAFHSVMTPSSSGGGGGGAAAGGGGSAGGF